MKDPLVTPDNDFIRIFKDKLKQINRSPQTIKLYIYGLKDFFTFLGRNQIKDLPLITRQTIEEYQALLFSLKEQSQSTIEIKLNALKQFFNFMTKAGHMSINPTDHILQYRRQQRLPGTVLTLRQMKRLLETPPVHTKKGILWRTILETFYSSGIRLQELCNLNLSDADHAEGIINIHSGKGARDRLIPLGRTACFWISTYIDTVRHIFIQDHSEQKLFIGVKGRPINLRLVERQIKRFAKQAGIRKTVTPHTLRHTAATHMIANGADVIFVQQILGHRNLDTSQKYIRIHQSDVRRMQKRFHPRELHAH
jgi:integrase/recombinase XerD